jgi:hypothetical protein
MPCVRQRHQTRELRVHDSSTIAATNERVLGFESNAAGRHPALAVAESSGCADPVVEETYDTATRTGDVAELATHPDYSQFRVAGEDWGPAVAYAVRLRPLAADDVRTGWHFSFFSLPHLPELLLAAGRPLRDRWSERIAKGNTEVDEAVPVVLVVRPADVGRLVAHEIASDDVTVAEEIADYEPAREPALDAEFEIAPGDRA